MNKPKRNHPWVRKIRSDCDQAVTKSTLARIGKEGVIAERRFERDFNERQNSAIRDMFRSGSLRGHVINGGTYN